MNKLSRVVGIFLLGVGTSVLTGALMLKYGKFETLYTPTEVKAIIIKSYQLGAEAGIVYCINHTKETI